MNEELSIMIRQGGPSDEGFVIQTWLRSYRKCSDFARKIHPKLFFAFHHPIVENIWRHPATIRLVACDPEAPEVIYGYFVFIPNGSLDVLYRLKMEPRPIVHYVYVKEAFRNMRVASRLIEAGGFDPSHIYFTHLTRDKTDMREFIKDQSGQRVPNPWYMKIRWRGADMLLQKWPLAWDEPEGGTPTKFIYHDGNLYVPYLT